MKDNRSSNKNIRPNFSVDVNSIIQPPTPWCSTVKWGAHHLFDISLNNSIIYSCFPLTDYYTNIGSNTSIQGRINDFVAITSNSIIRFDGETRAIKETAKYACCAGVYIPTQDIIVAVSATTSHFIFIRPEDMKHPIESEYRSMQFPCFHITFLKKSSTLVTSGNDIRIWNLKCVLPSRNIISIKPQINITLRATIDTGYEFTYLNPPCIDYLNELIILPRGNGFSAYNVDGQFIKEMSRLSTTPQTLSSFLPNENFEVDQNKNKKLANQKSTQKLYYQPNIASKNQSNNKSNDEKFDPNQIDNSAFITADSDCGICEWTPSGTIKKRHTSGNSKFIAIRLINKSFFLYIDIKNNIYIVDMLARTPRMFLVGSTHEKPLSMVLFRTRSVASALQFGLILCINTTIQLFQIVVPWKLFAPSLIKPSLIKLCPRRNRAARIQVQTSNSDLYLLSPKTAQPITSAAPNNPKKIIDTLYDRGLLIKEPRDQLIIVVENGEIVCYNTSDIPCQTITTIDYHAAAAFLAYADKSIFGNNNNNTNNLGRTAEQKAIEDENSNKPTEKEDNKETDDDSNQESDENSGKELCYCVATLNGEIFLCDYNTFKCKKRYIVQTGIVKTAKYDMMYGTVIISYINMLLRFDIQNGVIIEKLKQVPSGVVTCLEKGLLLIGYESGKITMLKIKETRMEIMKTEGVSYHTAAVTGFSFGSNFFLSSSEDQTIKIWSLKGETVGVISLPLPLYGIEIYNGKRDILVGTDKEVMVIEGQSIFMDEFERKDDILDNYNEKDDELTNDAISPLQIQEEEKQAFLFARKRSEQESENKNPKKDEESKNISVSGIIYLNNRSNRNNNKNRTETPQKKEIDEQTKKRIIEQMTKMTANATLTNRIAEREKMLLAQKTQQIENEYKLEKEKNGYSLEEQEIALKKRKEETLLKRKREQEEQERKERERKEKEERERREKKEKEEREKREREEQERREREERERKEKEEQERREREERERLEREEEERRHREEEEREEQERRHREEEERLEREEQERLEREEQERKHREEEEERLEKERLEREEQERKHKEEEEKLEKERIEKEKLEKEKQRLKAITPPDEDPSFKAPRTNQKQKEEEKKEKKKPKEKKKKKSKSPSPSPSKTAKEKVVKEEEKRVEPEANVITFPNVLLEEKPNTDSKENLPSNSPLSKTSSPSPKSPKSPRIKGSPKSKSKGKSKTAQPKDLDDELDDDDNDDIDNEDTEDGSKTSKSPPFKKELVKWISNDGKVFVQTKKGDWSDEQSRVFLRQQNGSFITSDGVFWGGPNVQKGKFVTLKGNKNLDSIGQRFMHFNEKIYTFLGDDKWSDNEGNIFTKRKDGKFATDNTRKAKVWIGPDGNGFFEKMNKPKQIVGKDGKVYKLNKKGDYSSGGKDDKSDEKKSFITNDGVLMIMIDQDTFLGSDGTVYRYDGQKNITNQNGKSYENQLRPPTPPPEPEPEPELEPEPEAAPEPEPEPQSEDVQKLHPSPSQSTENLNDKSTNNENENKNEVDNTNDNNNDINQNENDNENSIKKETEDEKEIENINKDAAIEEKEKEEKVEQKDTEKIKKKKESKDKKGKIDKKETEKEHSDKKKDKNEKEKKETKKKKEKIEKDEDEDEKEDEDESENDDEKDEEDESENDKDDESEKDDVEKDEEDESEKEDDDDDKESEDEDENENSKEDDEDENEDNYDDSEESDNKTKKSPSKGKSKTKETTETKEQDTTKAKTNKNIRDSTKANDKANNKSKDVKKTEGKDKPKSSTKSAAKSKNKEIKEDDENNPELMKDNIENEDSSIVNDYNSSTENGASNDEDGITGDENEDNSTNSKENNDNDETNENEENDSTNNANGGEINENIRDDENQHLSSKEDNKNEDENDNDEIGPDSKEINDNNSNDGSNQKESNDVTEAKTNNNETNSNENAETESKNDNNETNESTVNNNIDNNNEIEANNQNEEEVKENPDNNGSSNNEDEISKNASNNQDNVENQNEDASDHSNEAQVAENEVTSTDNSDNDDNINLKSNDDDNITVSNIDVFKPGEVYKSNDGSEYKKTDENTFVDQSGKEFKLNENGDFTAEDGTVMPLSHEELFWVEQNGSVYRPLNEDHKEEKEENEPKWINSDGKIFTPSDEVSNKNKNKSNSNEVSEKELNDVNENADYSSECNDDEDQQSYTTKLVAEDGTVWNGPNPASGKFGGKNIKKTPVQWVANDGVVFIPSNKDNSEWTNSENKKYIKEKESDPHFVLVENENDNESNNKNGNSKNRTNSSDDEQNKEIWEGPVIGQGHWVTGNGKVIDSDKGIWVAPDKKIYTAVKTGYVENDNGRLYKPFITSQGLISNITNNNDNQNSLEIANEIDDGNVLISDDGKKYLKIGEKEGKFISNSGEVYTATEDDGKEWVDGYGVVFHPHHEGNYLVSDETKQKWQGPPFFNNKRKIGAEYEGFKHGPVKLRYPSALTLPKHDVIYTNFEVNIGKPRSSTPLYKVPPLKYPPIVHSKYKPFRFRPKTPPGDNGYFYRKFNDQGESTRKKILRILNPHAIPPPNIVVDERQVIKMIESGQKQLIPLLKRIATQDPSNKLARAYLMKINEQKRSQSIEVNNASSINNQDVDIDIKHKYKGKFNIKFDLDLDTVAPTPIGNLLNNNDSNTYSVKSPSEKQQTKSARPFVHYNNVLNPINNEQDYLNLYISRSKARTKRRNNDDDDRYINFDNRYSSNDSYKSQRKASKTDEKMRAVSVHNIASDKQFENSMIAQTQSKPKLVIPHSARRYKKP